VVVEVFLFWVWKAAISQAFRIAAVPLGLIVAPGLLIFYILLTRITVQIAEKRSDSHDWVRKRTRKVPETIRITDTAIRIDDRVFSLGEIRRIKMNPERYLVYNNYNQRNYRKLRIETTGQTYEYILGHVAALKNCYYYPEYGALQRSVDAFLQQVGKKAIMITF
jgi:hypothetical protein